MNVITLSPPAFAIRRANHLGMCFGVRDAIALARQESRTRPVTILGQLVHNPVVLEQLRAQGLRFTEDAAQVATRTVMITAHGTSDRHRADLARRGLEVVESTCPLVHHAHRALRDLVEQGCHPVVIGQRGHVEVRGLTGDYPNHDVVLSEEEIIRLEPRRRFGVVAQTTQPLERVHRLLQCLRRQFPDAEVRFKDTVCQPTKQRQAAAEELARQCDVVVVVGGSQSNNTRELVATCAKACRAVHHVESERELREDWFQDVGIVGLTAGTSTPDEVIERVEQALRQIAESPITP